MWHCSPAVYYAILCGRDDNNKTRSISELSEGNGEENKWLTAVRPKNLSDTNWLLEICDYRSNMTAPITAMLHSLVSTVIFFLSFTLLHVSSLFHAQVSSTKMAKLKTKGCHFSTCLKWRSSKTITTGSQSESELQTGTPTDKPFK